MPKATSKLKKRRLQLRLTQAELAARAGISKRTVQLSERGQNISVTTLEQISEAIGLAAEEVTQAASFDALQEGPWSLHQYVTNRIFPGPSSNCKNAMDLQGSLGQMRKSWEVHLNQNGDLSNSKYAEPFRKQMEKGPVAFYDKYMNIWNANKNSVMYGTSKGKRNGVSAIVPLTDQAYEDLKSGELGFFDIDKTHVCEFSQNLLIDWGVEFHGPEHEQIAATSSLRFTAFFQVALLSRDVSSSDFRMLSFGASSKNEKRLKANGFIKCPGSTPYLGFSIYEFAADNSDLGSDDEVRKSTAQHYAQMIWNRFSNRVALRAKRKVILNIAHLYQSMLNQKLMNNSNRRAA